MSDAMGEKLDPVREKFAAAYVETGKASAALRKANPKSRKWKPETVHSESSRLKADPKVHARIAQLQEIARAKHDITIERLTDMLLDDREQAKDLGQPATAVSAVMGMAKLHGLVVDKSQATVLNVNFDDILRARLNAAKAIGNG